MDKDRQQANAVKEGQLYKKGLNLAACGWRKFIKKKNFKAAILLWPSGTFLCGKPHRGKHLTTTEMKQNTIGFSPHKSFCFNCWKLKMHRGTWKNYFAFCSGFCTHEIWFRSPSGHLKTIRCPWNGSGQRKDPTQATRMFQP